MRRAHSSLASAAHATCFRIVGMRRAMKCNEMALLLEHSWRQELVTQAMLQVCRYGFESVVTVNQSKRLAGPGGVDELWLSVVLSLLTRVDFGQVDGNTRGPWPEVAADEN